MVDYSKWDKLLRDESDDEDERDKKPRVQRFDAPQTVTFGGKDSSLQIGSAANQPAGRDPEDAAMDVEDDCENEPIEPDDAMLDVEGSEGDHREDILQCRALAERALQRGDAAEGVRLLEKAVKLGGADCPGLVDVLGAAKRQQAAAAGPAGEQASAARESASQQRQRQNGGTVENRYSWSQTQDTVFVNVFVPAGTKAKDVQLSVSETHVRITAAGKPVLEGEWEFKVVEEEDVDWELKDVAGHRAVCLTVRKAVMPGGFSVVVWWQRVLKGDPGIDLKEGIVDRKAGSQEAFAKAWAEAHAQFKEKMKDRQPIEVDVDGQSAEAS